MPCDYSIDGEHLLVRRYAWGDVTDADLLDHQQRIETDPLAASDFAHVIDVRAVTGITGVSGDCLAEVAHRHFGSVRARSAFVMPRADRFGLARLVEAYRQQAGVQNAIGVFHSLQQALTWLEVPAGRPHARVAGLTGTRRAPLLNPFGVPGVAPRLFVMQPRVANAGRVYFSSL